jgi:hypothetical protein
LKKLAFLGAAAGVAIGALLIGNTSKAADHLDAPNLFTGSAANPMADIGDVYAWMNSDATKINLAMTVSPADDTTRHFSPAVQYVFHVSEYAGATNGEAYGTQPTEHRVICTFASDTSAQCWVATGSTLIDYVKGDPSATAGISAVDGKIKVFAGRRSDPFFFNLGGFKTAVNGVETACGGGTPGACPGALATVPGVDAAGCPQLPAANVAPIRAALSAQAPANAVTAPCSGTVKDCFAAFDVEAIVVQIDKSLVLGSGHHLVSVWGSTHMGS